MLQKFLASKISGWIAIVALAGVLSLGGVVTYVVWKWKDMEARAAFCEGQNSVQPFLESLSKRAVDSVKKEERETIDEIEDIKESVKEAAEDPGIEGAIEDPTGCAAERAPDAILRYHGWVRDE